MTKINLRWILPINIINSLSAAVGANAVVVKKLKQILLIKVCGDQLQQQPRRDFLGQARASAAAASCSPTVEPATSQRTPHLLEVLKTLVCQCFFIVYKASESNRIAQ